MKPLFLLKTTHSDAVRPNPSVSLCVCVCGVSSTGKDIFLHFPNPYISLTFLLSPPPHHFPFTLLPVANNNSCSLAPHACCACVGAAVKMHIKQARQTLASSSLFLTLPRFRAGDYRRLQVLQGADCHGAVQPEAEHNRRAARWETHCPRPPSSRQLCRAVGANGSGKTNFFHGACHARRKETGLLVFLPPLPVLRSHPFRAGRPVHLHHGGEPRVAVARAFPVGVRARAVRSPFGPRRKGLATRC